MTRLVSQLQLPFPAPAYIGISVHGENTEMKVPFLDLFTITCVEELTQIYNVLKRLFKRQGILTPNQAHVWPALRMSRANPSLYLTSTPGDGRERIRRNAVPALPISVHCFPPVLYGIKKMLFQI